MQDVDRNATRGKKNSFKSRQSRKRYVPGLEEPLLLHVRDDESDGDGDERRKRVVREKRRTAE
jgi:hypothetical protein